jgi:site-specific recombinase XerD
MHMDELTTDNPTLQEAYERFCQVYMPNRNFSQVTRRGYVYDLQEWLNQCDLVRVKQISTNAIHLYMALLDARGLRGTTRHRKLAAIRTFLKFLEEEHILPKDFGDALTWPEIARDEPRPLAPSQYTALLREAAQKTRDLAMFETLLQTGIRLSKLTNLTLDDVTLPTKPSPDPATGYGLLRVKRKGRRLQELILNYKACRTMKAYLRERPMQAKTNILFLTKYGTPITNRSVQKAFKKYAVAAGIPWAHVHSFRTTHITEHIARKTDIKTVQGNAGHSNLATTNYYAQFVKGAQIRAMQENAL